MTRRDYQLLAISVRSMRALAPERRAYVALCLADSIAAAHPNFNRAKFLQACGATTTKENMQ